MRRALSKLVVVIGCALLASGCGAHASAKAPATVTVSASGTPAPAGSSGIAGHVEAGPTSPLSRPGVASSRPMAGIRVTVRSGPVSREGTVAGPVVASALSDATGAFRLPLAPGIYVVTAAAPAGLRPVPVTVTVVAAVYATVSVVLDTGIR